MSMHKLPLSRLEEEGLKVHGLSIETPSQLSDAFRQGIAWALSQQAEPAPAQDERGAFDSWFMDAPDDPNNRVEVMSVEDHERLVAALTRPAQKVNVVDTPEQQPVAWRRLEADDNESASWSYYSGPVEGGLPVYSAPVAQTAPQPEQSGLVEALAEFVALAEEREQELGALSPEMRECLENASSALSVQQTNKI